MGGEILFDKLLDEITKFSSDGIRPGLSRIELLLSRLGSPQREFKAVHVLGTNGKGSTAAALESIFMASGIKAALYISPHLVSLQERLRVNGAFLPFDSWQRAFDKLEEAVDSDDGLRAERPTLFESVTALCFLMIADAGVDAAVIEAGMGGRYDATSLCDAAAVVITPIGMDHMQYLGSTLSAIASEKFAAVRSGGTAFYAADDESLIGTFEEQCVSVGARGYLLDAMASAEDARLSLDGTTFSYRPAEGWGLTEMAGLCTPLIGLCQAENAARVVTTALMLRELADGFGAIDEAGIRAGLRATNWPGRFEVLRPWGPSRVVVLDGAHNEHAMSALAASIGELSSQGEINGVGAVVFAVMKDKDVTPMLNWLMTFNCPVYCSQAPTERAMPPDELARLAEDSGVNVRGAYASAMDALLAARDQTDPSKILLCCGSLYLVGYFEHALA
jgi:dihydrofolate synthase/folylpolyglutamate synthase